MKRIRLAWILVATAIAAFGLGGVSWAFHDGGVATCTGCHSMHSARSTDNLLMQSDNGSACLRCHERATDTGPSSYRVSTPSAKLAASTDVVLHRTPGGDFGWLRQTLTATSTFGGTVTNPGFERGHNIIAADNQYTLVDSASPPTPMPPGELSCTSCHDPHSRARRLSDGSIIHPTTGTTYDPTFESGSYGHVPVAGEAAGVYRLLGSSGYQAYDGGPTFPGNPAAVVNSTYNRSEVSTQTRVAYGYGASNGYSAWGKWCATCHPDYHTDTASNFVHTVDGALGGAATTYAAYVKSGDLTGTLATSYNSLVPFATNDNDTATLAALALVDDSDLTGPSGTDRIMCLSCHRAHASGWKYALRWNQESEFLTLSDASGASVYPGVDAGLGNQGQYNRGYTTAQMAAAYNGRLATEFAPHQRSMCNKCHAKD